LSYAEWVALLAQLRRQIENLAQQLQATIDTLNQLQSALSRLVIPTPLPTYVSTSVTLPVTAVGTVPVTVQNSTIPVDVTNAVQAQIINQPIQTYITTSTTLPINIATASIQVPISIQSSLINVPVTGAVTSLQGTVPWSTYISTSVTLPISGTVTATQGTTPWQAYISTSVTLPISGTVTATQGTTPWSTYISTSATVPISIVNATIQVPVSIQSSYINVPAYVVTSVNLPVVVTNTPVPVNINNTPIGVTQSTTPWNVYISTSAQLSVSISGVSKTSFVVVGGSTITASGSSSNYSATSYKDILVLIYIGSLSYIMMPALTIYFNAYDTYSGQNIPLASQAISSTGSYYIYVHDFPGTYFNISWVVQTSTVASNTYISVYEST